MCVESSFNVHHLLLDSQIYFDIKHEVRQQ